MPSPDQLLLFLLVVVRCLGFFAVGPLFTHQKVPVQIQAMAGIATAIALYPTVQLRPGPEMDSLPGFVLLLTREVLMGALIGLVAASLFAAIRFGGHIAGIQMGFSIGGIFDPASGEEMPLIGRMQELFAAMLFLLLDGHHILLRALGASLQKVPPGGFPDGAALLGIVGMVGTSVFQLALQVGAPVIAALFLTDTALGFVARAVPQMNVFSVGFPVKIAAGLLLLFATTPLLATLMSHYTKALEGQLLTVLAGM